MNFRDQIANLVKTDDEIYSQVCTVDEVDETNLTVDVSPLNGDAQIFNVRLVAGTGKGLEIYPTVGSVVIVTFLSKNTAFISGYSDVNYYTIQNEMESLKTMLEDLTNEYKVHTHPTPSGPTSAPVTGTTFATTFLQRIGRLFKK